MLEVDGDHGEYFVMTDRDIALEVADVFERAGLFPLG
jgi:hypothetical protein